MVIATRDQNWMIYALPKKRSCELEKNLKCLQDCVQSDPIFARDLVKLEKNLKCLQDCVQSDPIFARDLVKLAQLRKNCCEPAAVFATRKGE